MTSYIIGDTPQELLFHAAEMGDLPHVMEWIDKGASVNAQNKKGITPIFCAIEKYHSDIVDYLIAKGADVNFNYEYGTPIFYATRAGGSALSEEHEKNSVKIVKLLIANGARVSDIAVRRKTTLHFAAEWHNPEIIDLLLEHSDNITATEKDRKNKTPLHIAFEWGNLEVAKSFIRYILEKNPHLNGELSEYVYKCKAEIEKMEKHKDDSIAENTLCTQPDLTLQESLPESTETPPTVKKPKISELAKTAEKQEEKDTMPPDFSKLLIEYILKEYPNARKPDFLDQNEELLRHWNKHAPSTNLSEAVAMDCTSQQLQ